MNTLSAAGLPAWCHGRHFRWFAAAVFLVAVVGWLVPISDPTGTDAGTDQSLGEAPQNSTLEDLTAFIDVNRWGVSLREVNGRLADEKARLGDGSGLNPALKALGYVGLVVEADTKTVLLTRIDGTVARLEPGDALLDGRILAEVEGNRITLWAADGGEVEVLDMFPRPAAQAEEKRNPNEQRPR